MNEDQWRTTTDFPAMLALVRPQASDRQLRQLAIGFARFQWADLSAEGRRVVELAERFADDPGVSGALTVAVQALSSSVLPGRRRSERIGAEAAARRCAAGNPSDAIPDYDYLSETFARALCDLVRELFGNPFRPSRLEPSWLTFQGGIVERLARDVYQRRAWDEMGVLADALEDAGCTDAPLLSHLRGGGPHAFGCWVLELLTDGRPGTAAPQEERPRPVTGDAELEQARAEEANRPCPGCGSVKDRRVLRVQKEGPNTGRLFVKCFGCQRFDWLDVKSAPVVEDDPELAQLRSQPPLCYADCGPVEVGRVRKPGRNQGRLYTRCPRCGAFCWQR